jgi:hypothetical protein
VGCYCVGNLVAQQRQPSLRACELCKKEGKGKGGECTIGAYSSILPRNSRSETSFFRGIRGSAMSSMGRVEVGGWSVISKSVGRGSVVMFIEMSGSVSRGSVSWDGLLMDPVRVEEEGGDAMVIKLEVVLCIAQGQRSQFIGNEAGIRWKMEDKRGCCLRGVM